MRPVPLPVRWRPAEQPLPPAAAAARGAAARRLAARLLQRDEPALGRLTGVGGDGVLVVLGDPEELPWTDGIRYLGRAAEAPALLLPTALSPSVPLPLLERALLGRGLAAPLGVLPGGVGGGGLLVPLGAARRLGHAGLRAWLAGQGGAGAP